MVVTPEAAVLPDDIMVVEPQNHKFYTSGEFKTPGGYPYKEGLTVAPGDSLAGGLTEKAERGDLRVLRPTKGQEETLRVSWTRSSCPMTSLWWPKASGSMSAGKSEPPGRYLYEKGLTVHKAISMAGGLQRERKRARSK